MTDKPVEPGFPTVWTYWETLPGRRKPAHIELCHRAMAMNSGDGVQLRVIGPGDLKALDLDLHPGWRSLEEPAHRADYLRVALLERYGGLWLDSDVITLRSYAPILRLLKEYDFVGWEYRSGTSGENVSYRVSMGALAARPRLQLMTTWLREIDSVFDSGPSADRSTWHALGRHIMNPLLQELVESNSMTYCALHAERSTVPIKAKQRSKFFEKGSIVPLVKDDPLQSHISYFNSWMPEIGERTEDEILHGDAIIEKLFQYALLPERRTTLLGRDARFSQIERFGRKLPVAVRRPARNVVKRLTPSTWARNRT